MATVEEISNRVSRLEGAYDHLATKVDLANLKADLIPWMVGTLDVGMAAAVAATSAVVRALGYWTLN